MNFEAPEIPSPEELTELPSGEVPLGHEIPNTIHPTVGIEYIRQLINTMGANDSENALLDDIKTRLEQGKISAQEAIKEGYAIFDGKQDYH